ncbi:hypothetical protein Leryth_011637 [Lithospermum erythrorhizon]|nr:hypothetical protein Leryth_011637 [Lithospermum erythrorhizon]
MSTYKVCYCFRRKFKLKETEAPPEIKSLFQDYSENGYMTCDNMLKFLNEVQGEQDVTLEDADTLMDSIIREFRHLHILHRKHINLDLFFRHLFDEANSLLVSPNKVQHDMTAPLSNYFIYTSHNTYLTGNQLSSDCSDVPIIEALHRGVRVIELDMWPSSAKDDIDILHGGTLTSPVKLIKCLQSIKEHAFVTSEYPVILTLEDHLTPNLQAKVAEMVTQVFGDVLFSTGPKNEYLPVFPSPQDLKRRIIISTKPPKQYLEDKSPKEKEPSDQKEKKPSEENAWGREISKTFQKVDGNENDEEEDESSSEVKNMAQDAGSEYKHLIGFKARKVIGKTEEWIKVDPNRAERISLGEEKFEKVVMSHGLDMIRFTQSNLVRVYPKSMRIDSSNFNPLLGWMHGVQLVAFNMQGYGRHLWLMQGLFRANGGCGYVKKPDLLLKSGTNNEIFDPKKSLPVVKILKVKVFMGEGWNLDFHRTHFDSYSPPDFYVKVGIAGVPDDSVVKKTKTIEDSWIPSWNEEFEFPLTVPELALLRIEVHEYDMSEKDDFGGQTCLPVSELRTGIRSVPLHDEKIQTILMT